MASKQIASLQSTTHVQFIMQTLIPYYELAEMSPEKHNMNSDSILELVLHFWVYNNDWHPNERRRVQHWLVAVFCGSTTARAGSIVESSCCYRYSNEAVEYRDIDLELKKLLQVASGLPPHYTRKTFYVSQCDDRANHFKS